MPIATGISPTRAGQGSLPLGMQAHSALGGCGPALVHSIPAASRDFPVPPPWRRPRTAWRRAARSGVRCGVFCRHCSPRQPPWRRPACPSAPERPVAALGGIDARRHAYFFTPSAYGGVKRGAGKTLRPPSCKGGGLPAPPGAPDPPIAAVRLRPPLPPAARRHPRMRRPAELPQRSAAGTSQCASWVLAGLHIGGLRLWPAGPQPPPRTLAVPV